MATDSMDAVGLAIRDRLLTFVSLSHGTLASQLGTMSGAGSTGKLFLEEAPENVTYPYGVMKLGGFTHLPREDGKFGFTSLVEVLLYHYPRENVDALRKMGDTVEEAWRHWVDASIIVSMRVEERATIKFEPPADREMVLERLLLSYYTYPSFLTQYSA